VQKSRLSEDLWETVSVLARYFDGMKCGHVGSDGYRKTSDMRVLLDVVRDLLNCGVIDPDKTVFLDLGSGDGRVCMLMSYFCKWSIGVELEDFIYEEYFQRRREVDLLLSQGLLPLGNNLCILNGDALNDDTHRQVESITGISLRDVDIFYTYITLHDVYADMLQKKANPGSFYMVYGFSAILPRYDGFTLLNPDVGGHRLVALYRLNSKVKL